MKHSIHLNTAEDYLKTCDKKYNLCYIDPPFNTGKKQSIKGKSYQDDYSDYKSFIYPILQQLHTTLKEDGSIFIHLDWHEAHYVKVWMDEIFGRSNFRNEIIWAYDYGARQKNKWPTKHDTIFWYTKSDNYTFNYNQIDRIPYMAPGLAGPDKASRGKTPTDVWWHTIVPTSGKERVGYPTQKPVGLLQWIVKVHSNTNDECLDCFAGAGSFGEACLLNSRNVDLVDKNAEAVTIMTERLGKYVVDCSRSTKISKE